MAETNSDSISNVKTEDVSIWQRVKEELNEHILFIEQLLEKYTFSNEFKAYILSEIEKIKAKQNEKDLNMAVVGEFSSGKSSFINSFLREELLETDVVQGTTIAATLMRYNPDKNITGITLNGEKRKILQSDNTLQLAEKLKEYTAGKSNEFCKLEVGYPSDFLKQGICIIDTPGTNSLEQWHEEVTKKAIKEQADACIVLISAEKPLPQTFQRFLEENISESLSICVFVVTKIDLINKKEQARQLKYIERILQDKLSVKNPLVLPYCSLFSDNSAAGEYAELNSNTEEALVRFLTEQRAKIQIQRCASLLENAMAYLNQGMHNLSNEQKLKYEELNSSITTDLAVFIKRSKKKYKSVYEDNICVEAQNFIQKLSNSVSILKKEVEDEFLGIKDSAELKKFLSKGLEETLEKQKDNLLIYLKILEKVRFQEIDETVSKCKRYFERDFKLEYKQLILLAHSLDIVVEFENNLVINTQSAITISQKTKAFEKSENKSLFGGAAAGAAIGSVVPGVGTLAGLLIGGVAGLVMMPNVHNLRAQVSDDVNNAIAKYFMDLEDHIIQAYNANVQQGWLEIEKIMTMYLEKYTTVVNDMKLKYKKEQTEVEKFLISIEQDITSLQYKTAQIQSMKINMLNL